MRNSYSFKTNVTVFNPNNNKIILNYFLQFILAYNKFIRLKFQSLKK